MARQLKWKAYMVFQRGVIAAIDQQRPDLARRARADPRPRPGEDRAVRRRHPRRRPPPDLAIVDEVDANASPCDMRRRFWQEPTKTARRFLMRGDYSRTASKLDLCCLRFLRPRIYL